MNQELTSPPPHDAACSPSLMPETDSAWEIFQNSPHDDAGDPWALCSRMERERDEAIKDAEKARAYKKVLKNENARLRRMPNLLENEKRLASADENLTDHEK